MSESDLKEREEASGQQEKIDGGIAPGELAALDQIEAGLRDSANDEIPFNENDPDKPKGFRRFVTKRKTLGGLIIGLLLGGSLGMATITSGPLQFIHIAQLLQRFHFQSVEDTGNGRMLKLYKHVKNQKAGTVENTRLGVLGNKIAKSIDARYENIGLEKKFSDGLTAKYEGMQLDPVKFSENAQNGNEFKRLGEEDFMAKFKESYNVDIVPNGDGTFTIPAESGIFAYFKNKNLNSLMSEESGLNKISAAVATRVMGKRDGITWHPIKAADAYIVGTLDEKFSAWLREQKERIRNGNDEPLSATGEPATDDNNKPDPAKSGENASAADSTNQAASDATKSLDETGNLDPEKATGVIKQLTESTGGKVVMGATAVIGLSCALKGISDAAASVKHDMVILPIIRMGMQAMAVGNQTGSSVDMSNEQLGFFAKQLYSDENGSWASARSIQAELGEEQTGPDIPDEANPAKIQSGGMFSAILNSIPALGTICKATESTVGKAFSFAVSLTTPIATIVTTAITSSPQFKQAISGVIKWMAGGPIPTMVFGSTYGSYINYGAKFASDDAAASMGGVKLSDKQTAELRDFRNQSLQQELKQRSFAQRMFDPYSPDSLVSKAIDSTSPSPTANIASLVATLTSPLKVLSVFKTPFMPKVSALTNFNYGSPDVGFSLEDLNSDALDDPYDNGTQATAILTGSKGQTFITRAQKCFGVKLGTDGSVSKDMKAKIDPTSKDYDGYGCADQDMDWTRVRFYILDMTTGQGSVCYDYADTEACQQSGFGQTSTTGNGTNVGVPGDGFRGVDTSGQSCPSGSSDLGVKQVPTGDNLPPSVQKYNIRLCGIPEIPGGMNVAIVGNVMSLIADAKAAGLQLSGSSFRTTDSQVSLRTTNCGSTSYDIYEKPSGECNPPTAIPGTSMHEQGLAIDFNNCGDHGTACYGWLSANAANYGLKNLPSEPWHWSTTGN